MLKVTKGWLALHNTDALERVRATLETRRDKGTITPADRTVLEWIYQLLEERKPRNDKPEQTSFL